MTATLLFLLLSGFIFDLYTLVSGAVTAIGPYILASLRYLSVVRSDQNITQRLATFAIVFVAAV